MRVTVEGNIGCGKSTALDRLKAMRPDLAVCKEPVEEWDGLLARFYEDPARWAFPMQLQVLLSFGGSAPDLAVVERSPLSCRHVFAQMLFNDNKMTQEQWDLFKDYCDVLGWTPDVIVYVHTPADQCHARMRERGREAEGAVDLAYLKRIEFQYDTMLRYADVPVVRLDGTAAPEAIASALADIVDQARAKALSRPTPS